ncbi:MAG: FtsH protease activity modulator HflK [Bauldia litoralis]
MPWKNQTGGDKGGGPWGSGNGGDNGPWGQGPRKGTGRRGGSQPPNFEDMIKRGQDNVRRVLPGGFGSGRGIALIVLIVIVVWMLTGFYQVKPQQAGVELVFGRVTNVTSQGLHWNWPAPIGEVETPDVKVERRTYVGLVQIGPNASESVRRVPRESLMLTGDENIIDIQAVVFWKIDERPKTVKRDGQDVAMTPGIRDFLFNIRNPDKAVKDATEAAMREIVGKNEFENIRTTGRVAIEQEALKVIQRILDEYGAGVNVLRVQLQAVDPPQRVISAFRDVQAARADRDSMIENANKYLNRIIQEAEGESERIARAAEAFKEERIAIATGDTRRFLSIFEQYESAKDITRTRIYVETMRDILKDMDKIIIDKNGRSGVVPYLPLNELNKSRTASPSSVTPPSTTQSPTGRNRETSDRLGGQQ